MSDMTTRLSIVADVVGQGEIKGLQVGLGKVTGQTNKATTAMGRLRTAAGGALGAMRSFLPVLGVAGIAAFAKKNLDAADSMSKLSQRTGIAAPTLDKFRKVAELSDTSIQSLERAFPALTKNMDIAAQKGKGPAFEAFERLGVSVKNADGSLRAADDVMLQVSDRFANMADGAEKSALASQIFGTRIGSELIPLLNSGGDAVRNMGTALTQDFADKAAAFNDRLENMQEKFGDLGLRLTESLLPALESLVGIVEGALNAFAALPGPVQSIIAAVTALSAAMLVLSPIIPPIAAAFGAIASLKIGALFAAIVPVITTVGGALSGLLPIIAGIFTGPVGWAALLIGAGAAIFAFRDQIGEFLGGLLQPFKDVFNAVGEAIKAPFQAAMEFLKGIVNNMLNAVGGAVKSVINAINGLIKGANAALRLLKLPTIPLLPSPTIPQFAKGGMVNGPTLGLVGEAGPEYIVPARKAQGFAQNIMNGVRGPGAIPRFAEGGFVGPASANVNIQTGPVTQMNGQNFVTTQEMSRAVQSGVAQTLDLLRRDGSTRAALGLA